MSEALRFNEGKPKLSYFMRSFRWMTAAVARVKEFGANKYKEDNWRAGNKPDTEYLDSCFRHLDYFFGGEFYDQDSGCSHLAHAVWNLSALAELNYPDEPIVDEELFAERMAYWAEKKREREEERQRILNDPKWDSVPEFVCPRGGGAYVRKPVNDDDNSPSDLDVDPCPTPCESECYPVCNDWRTCVRVVPGTSREEAIDGMDVRSGNTICDDGTQVSVDSSPMKGFDCFEEGVNEILAKSADEVWEEERQRILNDPKWDNVPEFLCPRGGGAYIRTRASVEGPADCYIPAEWAFPAGPLTSAIVLSEWEIPEVPPEEPPYSSEVPLECPKCNSQNVGVNCGLELYHYCIDCGEIFDFNSLLRTPVGWLRNGVPGRACDELWQKEWDRMMREKSIIGKLATQDLPDARDCEDDLCPGEPPCKKVGDITFTLEVPESSSRVRELTDQVMRDFAAAGWDGQTPIEIETTPEGGARAVADVMRLKNCPGRPIAEVMAELDKAARDRPLGQPLGECVAETMRRLDNPGIDEVMNRCAVDKQGKSLYTQMMDAVTEESE